MIQNYLPGFLPEPLYPNVEGWPVLNTGHPGRAGYQSGWIHRRFYPTADEALADAEMANRLARVPLSVIEQPVDEQFRKYWPEKTNWRLSLEPPSPGHLGSAYYPRPAYYIVDFNALMPVVFIQGERG